MRTITERHKKNISDSIRAQHARWKADGVYEKRKKERELAKREQKIGRREEALEKRETGNI